MSDMSYPTKEKSQFMNVQGGEKKVMKKILSVALSTAMAFSMFASVAFGETATTPQAKFDALAAKGVLNGYPDGQAHLEKDLTRAEFAKIVTKLFGLSEVTGKLSYKDKGYTATNWAVPYIEAVTAANLMQGKDTVKGIFDYNGKVTVQEVAAVLFRALKLETPATTDNSASAWAKGYAQAVINAGLVAQGTNFKANATRSLVVEAAYAVDNMTTKVAVAGAEALTPTTVLVTFADKTTTTLTLTTALVEGVETTIPTFKYKGFDYAGVKVTLAAPKVVSVTAPNSKQLVVKFNRALDSKTVIGTTYGTDTLAPGAIAVTTLTDAQPVDIRYANATLSSDKTELVLTPAGSAYFKGQYTVTVTADVKTDTGVKVTPYTTLLTVADTTAPTIVSVTSTAKATTNKVVVKFSEPVQDGAVAYVDGVSATVPTGSARSSLDEVVLTTSTTLVTGKTYDVSFLNVKDFAGNYIAPNPTKTTVTVVADVELPTISSFAVSGEDTIKVVFSKAVDINSLNGVFTLLNSNGVSQGTLVPSKGSDSKTFTLKTPTIPVFTNGVFNGTVVIGAGIRDLLGNVTTATSTQAVTFTKDSVAPTVSSVTYTSTGLAVKFSENVEVKGSSFTLVNDATGVPTPVTVATYKNEDGVVTFNNVTGLAAGSYTLRLPAGFVVDLSSSANKSAATVLPVTITATTSTDSKAPVFISAPVVVPTPKSASDQQVTYTIQDASGLNLNTVRDINNYTLDSKALPAGSYVTTNYTGKASDNLVVNVYIPSSGISASKGFDFLITGVQDAAGNAITPQLAKLALVDGVAPKLATATISADDATKLIVNFTEPVKGIDATKFVVKVNGVEATNGVAIASVSGSKYFITISAIQDKYNGADVLYFDNNKDGKVQASEIVAYTSAKTGVIDLSSSFVNAISVTIADKSGVTDMDDNAIDNSVTVNVAK
ncbi:Ig-like domain-containing protein [Paenibacillus tianjinensis]|uniref:Ig-like domain-containing protein n=1 Tax=Paenibacillus tianjinensis TaxID=2810347 RepID=A0ABX7LA11_9BACL|nr:Ig-like domain-containing protein [Paenibacillus tianjinensis]QSF44751.1 Ig-like domain-containing protein [Paenibacillus tianjinensis]